MPWVGEEQFLDLQGPYIRQNNTNSAPWACCKAVWRLNTQIPDREQGAINSDHVRLLSLFSLFFFLASSGQEDWLDSLEEHPFLLLSLSRLVHYGCFQGGVSKGL